jgi:hypothetical protein
MRRTQWHLGEINLGIRHFCLPLFHLISLNLFTYTMKRRITFIQRVDASFDPQQAVLTASSLSVRGLDAAREDRITVGLDELPEEVRRVLDCRVYWELGKANLFVLCLVACCPRAISWAPPPLGLREVFWCCCAIQQPGFTWTACALYSARVGIIFVSSVLHIGFGE